MTASLDLLGRAAATALLELVDASVDEQTTTEDLIAAMAGGHVVMRVEDARASRGRGRRILVIAAALTATAAAMMVLGFLVGGRQQQHPVVPPTSTSDTSTTNLVAPVLGWLRSIGSKEQNAVSPLPVMVLRDGRVVLASQSFSGPIAIRALDPESGLTEEIGTTVQPRSVSAFVELPDQRLLVIGGDRPAVNANGVAGLASAATVEVVSLVTGASSTLGVIPGVEGSEKVEAMLLENGSVLMLFGGGTAMVFDPATNSLSPTQPRTNTTTALGLFPMSDGRVLVFSAQPSVYDPTTRTFTDLPGFENLGDPRVIVQLADGRVLSTRGHCGVDLSRDGQGRDGDFGAVETDLFDPATGQFSQGPSLPHCADASVLLSSGRVFVAGRWQQNGKDVTWSGVLDVRTGETTAMPRPNRVDSTAVALDDGRVLLVGGVSATWADVFDETETG